MPDDAARWRSSLHFARLIGNNRSPLAQSQSWSHGPGRNHSWKKLARWLPTDKQLGSLKFVFLGFSLADSVRKPHVHQKMKNTQNIEIFAKSHEQPKSQHKPKQGPSLLNLPKMVDSEKNRIHDPVQLPQKRRLLH